MQVGYRFVPTDEEIIKYYLLTKVRGQELPWDGMKEIDLYGDKSPWEICDKSKETHRYLLTKLKRAGKKRIARTAGSGTWHGEDTGQEIYGRQTKKQIGLKKLFSFKVEGDRKKTKNWIMHEISLARDSLSGESNSDDYVLCKIVKKVVSKRSKESTIDPITTSSDEEVDISCGISNAKNPTRNF